MDSKYDHKLSEKKWQKKWQNAQVYTPNLEEPRSRRYYNLMMFPYPSAEGLHVGNMYAFTGADIHGRFMRMQNMEVFEPIGLDGFGIHSENYAIKIGKHPKNHAKDAEINFYTQLGSIGNGFAWDSRLETYDPNYYKWTQWLFTQAFKAGLAYKKKAQVNWCPSCKTVLADEQVENNKCERCKHEVVRREMSSWFFKITKYADRLLENIEKIDWPEKIKIAQRQWIGRSEGAEVKFEIQNSKKQISVFTTKLHTLNGATFLVLSPEVAKKHIDMVSESNLEDVSKYIEKSLNRTEEERKKGEKQKTGVDMGFTALNPANSKSIPVYVADYVLSDVGTGAIMAVPEGDERDEAFAKKYKLPIESSKTDKATLDRLLSEKVAEKQVNYHLRDWGISRQRYWGPPIPMINCEKCGWVPVPTEDLPVALPDIDDFKPKGDGTSPLSNAPDDWKYVNCPECGEKAERELDVSDTFLDSSWYFLAYPNLDTKEYKGNESPLNKEITKNWLPVDTYIGGAEHAVLHLLYARFITMMLHDLDFLDFEEPFPFFYSHGLIIKDGAKMSKSRGNVVNPEEYVEKYGADALRTYLMFLGPYDQGGDFSDSGIEGMRRFLDRVWSLFSTCQEDGLSQTQSKEVKTKLHKTIKRVTNDISKFRYNTAISAIMELVNKMREDTKALDKNSLEVLVKLLAPFAPHVAEELWVETMGNEFTVHKSNWPEHKDELTIDSEVAVAVQVNGKLRATLMFELEDASDKSIVETKAKGNENVTRHLEGKKVKQAIFVPGKIINFVV